MTEEEAEMLGHADAEDFGIADREAQPWAFGWYDHGGRKHVYPYLPTVFNPNLADGDGPIFPLYAHPPADTLADLQTEASPVADNSDIATIAYLAGAKDARDKLAALQAKSDRTMTDHGRLLWRDDVEGVCHSPDLCFEHSDTVRCGPCAIKQAEESGIATADNLPNLPEVSRLNREIAALQAHADALAGYGEHTSTCDIMTHGVWSDPTPCTCGWGATFRAYEAFKAGEPT